MATEQELIFWSLAANTLRAYGYWPSRLEWNAWSRTYELWANQPGLRGSERKVTVFPDWFVSSVASRQLHEAVVRNLFG